MRTRVTTTSNQGKKCWVISPIWSDPNKLKGKKKKSKRRGVYVMLRGFVCCWPMVLPCDKLSREKKGDFLIPNLIKSDKESVVELFVLSYNLSMYFLLLS
jgi:hypothetical protein